LLSRMLQTIHKYDKGKLLDITHSLPDDSLTAFNNASSTELPADYRQIRNIVISGMGGSCISGDLLRSYLYEKSAIPVLLNRTSTLPAFAGAESLCIFNSYSGTTYETLQCAREAFQRNCKCIVITHGGELEKLAGENGAVTVRLTGTPKMPRAAIGELFYSLLGILQSIKPLNIDIQEVRASITGLEETRKNSDIRYNADNPVIQLAAELTGKNIAVFGVSPVTEAVALRWKNQFNENSKAVVLYNYFPELTHNEIVGLSAADLSNYYFLVLRDESEDSTIKKQIAATMGFFGKSAGIRHFAESGRTLLERQMKLLYTGDYLSIYLALLRGIDPTPIDTITLLKEKMKEA
jgi:glucose/mannose-6-phosphate isomerase